MPVSCLARLPVLLRVLVLGGAGDAWPVFPLGRDCLKWPLWSQGRTGAAGALQKTDAGWRAEEVVERLAVRWGGRDTSRHGMEAG